MADAHVLKGCCVPRTGVYLYLTWVETRRRALAGFLQSEGGSGTGNAMEVRRVVILEIIRVRMGIGRKRVLSVLGWRFSWRWILGRRWIHLLGVGSLEKREQGKHASV